MNSRVEKYQYNEEETQIPSRLEKNRELYNNVDISELSRVTPNSNVRVLENAPRTIDIEKIKQYIEESGDEPERIRRVVVNEDIVVKRPEVQEKREYDINSVLEKAKQSREIYYEDEKHKKLRDTQYDILSKIKMYEEEVPVQKEKIEFNTDEKTLIDLINTVTLSKRNDDLLSELRGGDNTVVTSPINEEAKDDYIEKIISDKLDAPVTVDQTPEEEQNLDSTMVKNLDKSFYTNSTSFSKEDFEGLEELEKKVKKNGAFVKFIVVLLTFLLIGTVYVILKYVLNII